MNYFQKKELNIEKVYVKSEEKLERTKRTATDFYTATGVQLSFFIPYLGILVNVLYFCPTISYLLK